MSNPTRVELVQAARMLLRATAGKPSTCIMPPRLALEVVRDHFRALVNEAYQLYITAREVESEAWGALPPLEQKILVRAGRHVSYLGGCYHELASTSSYWWSAIR